jgi:phage gpG-like protein
MSPASVRGLQIRRQVFQNSVPQLAFSPSVGIIARDVDKLGLDIRSFREPLKRSVQRVIIPSIQKNFDDEGRPESWEPYAESTIDIRERQGSPVGKLLDKTGALRTAMKRLNIWTINDTAAILLDLPSNVSYGKIHQQGLSGAAKRAKGAGGAFNKRQRDIRKAIQEGKTLRTAVEIPARPFVMIQDDDVFAIEAIFSEWLNERIAARWSRRG